MIENLNPLKSAYVRDLLSSLLLVAEQLPHSKRATLITRYDHIYGDLGGQRALSDEQIKDYISSSLSEGQGNRYSFILSLETYFSIVCDLISASAISGSPERFLEELSTFKDEKFRKKIASIIEGKFHTEKGILHFQDSVNLGWFVEYLNSDGLNNIKILCRNLSVLWNDHNFMGGIIDPMQIIHEEVFP